MTSKLAARAGPGKLAPMKISLVSLLAAALFAGGCSTNTVMVGLQTELAGITREGDGATRVSWRVVNPNIVSYLVAGAEHRIYLNGTLVGVAKSREPLAVPAQSKADRTSVLATAGAEAERVLATTLKTGSANYRLESAITIRLYGEATEKGTLTATGVVPVTRK